MRVVPSRRPPQVAVGRRAPVPDDVEARYRRWIREHEPDSAALTLQRGAAFEYRPLISVVMPVFDPPLRVLRDAIDSVLDQTYRHLELCIANGGADSGVRRLIDDAAARDSRVRVAHIDRNWGISGNTNTALGLAGGEFVALADHDDLLAPFALFSVAETLNARRDLDVLYSDEDRIADSGARVQPFMKPDWSPELLHSFMYVGHLAVYRRSLLTELGGFRAEFDGSQDYDLVLRASELTDRISHIPQVLYHWRMLRESAASSSGAKPGARAANAAALGDAMRRRGLPGQLSVYPHSNRFKFDRSRVATPLVSVVVPTDDVALATTCLSHLCSMTAYPRLEVVVVTSARVAAGLESRFHSPFIRYVVFDGPFNFSKKCNAGAVLADGEYLVFLNDDVTPLSWDWLDSMLEYAQQPEVGGVSPKLLYADDTIQYAGMVTGVPGLVGTAFHTAPRYGNQYRNMALSIRNVSVLSGACLMLSAAAFRSVGGWDDVNTPVANSDLDLSFRLRARGLRLVYTPFAELRHVGRQSIGRIAPAPPDASPQFMRERWGDAVGYDPYFPPNMRALLYPDERRAPVAPLASAAAAQRRSVLLVSHDLSLTGAPIILCEVARYLRSVGMFVTVASPEDGALREAYRASDIPVVIEPRVLTHWPEARRLLGAFDLVVPNTVLGWNVVLSARSAEVPCVWLVHESRFGEDLAAGSRGCADAFQAAGAVVFPSRSAARLYERFFDGAPGLAVYYGIDDPAAQQVVTPPFFRDPSHLRLVQVGTVEHRKGADVLVAALRLMPAAVVETTDVLFVGRLHELDYVGRVRAAAHGLPNVKFVGEVSRSEVLGYMSCADAVVCSSRDETGPIVVIEAMALGKAVVSTKVGAAAEVITSGEDGVLVDVGDAGALSLALTIGLDAEDRRRLGRAARATYERELTIGRYGRDLLAVFTRVMDGAR